MKKILCLMFALSILLCACSGSPQNTATADPEVYIAKNATVTFLDAHTEAIPHTPHGTLYVDFNFEVTGSEAASMYFTVQIKAFQDGSEITHYNFPSGEVLPGYSKTYTYEFDLYNTESPVLIQYCTWGKSKVVSEFTVDIAP